MGEAERAAISPPASSAASPALLLLTAIALPGRLSSLGGRGSKWSLWKSQCDIQGRVSCLSALLTLSFQQFQSWGMLSASAALDAAVG